MEPPGQQPSFEAGILAPCREVGLAPLKDCLVQLSLAVVESLAAFLKSIYWEVTRSKERLRHSTIITYMRIHNYYSHYFVFDHGWYDVAL